MPEVSAGSVYVDIQPFLDQLGLAEKQADQLNGAVRAVGESTTKSFAAAAASQTQFAEKIAAGRAELAGIAAAARDTQGEIRRLTERGRELEQSIKKSSGADESKKWSAELAKNSDKIKEAKFNLEELRKSTEKERASITAVVDARRKETAETKLTAAAAKDAAVATKQQADATNETGKSTGFLTGALQKGLAAGAAFFAFSKVVEFKDNVEEAVVNVERLRSRLTTAFDGNADKANAAVIQLAEFADLAGQNVDQLGDSYANLVNRGITPTKTQLRQLADIAATSGKSIDQYAEAVVDSIAGQNDRLAEFGISAKQSGDKVAFTFRGVTTEVVKTREAIAGYLFGLGDLRGVQGAAIAQAQETAGENNRLSNSFTELFRVIGERGAPAFNALTRGLRTLTQQITESLKSNEQKAAELAARQSDGIATAAEKRLAAVAARAKASGEDIQKAVERSFIQTALADGRAVAEAEQRLRAFNEAPDPRLGSREGGSDIRVAQIRKEALALENAVALAKTRQRVNEEAFRKVEAAGKAEESQLGRIEALKALIAANEKKRNEAPDTKQGNAERVRLNALLKDENKLLDELLGKEEKLRKARQLSYEAQLRALLQERASLSQLAQRAAIRTADTAAGVALATFNQQLAEIDAVKAKLEQRERDLAAQARKVGGGRAVGRLGELADGRVDGVQEQELIQLRVAATDAYYTALYKITAEREQRLFDLRESTNAKEVEEVDRKFDRLIKATTDGIERQAIEEERQREQTALRAVQEQRRIEQARALADAVAGGTAQVYGRGTGVSKIDAERNEQKQRLENERVFLQDSLNNTLNKLGKEAEIERQALSGQLLRVKHQQDALAIQEKLSKFSIYRLILGENDDELTRAALDKVVGNVVNSYQEIVAADANAAAARAATATQNIADLSATLAAQIQLNKDGSASNIQATLDQIAAEKEARREALKDQRAAAKEKVVIDALTQASSIATAAAEVFAVFAPLGPFGIAAGIAGAALIVGAFTAAKVRAFSAANEIGKGGFFKGGYTGGTSATEERGVVHGKEFVHTAETTDKYRHPLFEALHAGRPQDIDWSSPAMQKLLPDYALPGKLREEKQASLSFYSHANMAPVVDKLGGLETRLAGIEQTNRQMADKWDSHTLPDGNVMLVDPSTGSTHLIVRG